MRAVLCIVCGETKLIAARNYHRKFMTSHRFVVSQLLVSSFFFLRFVFFLSSAGNGIFVSSETTNSDGREANHTLRSNGQRLGQIRFGHRGSQMKKNKNAESNLSILMC